MTRRVMARQRKRAAEGWGKRGFVRNGVVFIVVDVMAVVFQSVKGDFWIIRRIVYIGLGVGF